MDAYMYRKREYWIIISADEENTIWSKSFSPVSITIFITNKNDNDD